MFDFIGDWNPQLLRELKGQLKPLKILVAIAIAIIGQIIFLVIMMGNLPGSLSPTDMTVTTYPELYLTYAAKDSPELFRIQSLYYKPPLDHRPGQDFLVEPPGVATGDRIVAIDGVPLVAGDDYIEGNAQQMVMDAIVQPFADDWKNLTTVPSLITPKVVASAERLRQVIPGTSVTLRVEKSGASDAEPIDVTLPRIIASTRSSPYCLMPEGWEDLSRSTQYPSDSSGPPRSTTYGETFYQEFCQVEQGQQRYHINWSRWHQDAFWVLSLAIIFPLLILGGYSIINNLLKEERDGTFNFIRLSPRSAWDILGGKMIGVPMLIYGAVLLTLPLNLIHGLMGGVPMGMVLSLYGAVILLTFLTFSFAVLFGLIKMGIGVIQSWLGAGAIFLIQLLCLQAVRFGSSSDSDIFAWAFLFTPFSMLRPMDRPPFIDQYAVDAANSDLFSWFGMPMVPMVVGVLLVVNSVVLGHWVWQALERRFFMPTGTIISKAQSYGLTLFVNLCLVGFSWRSPESSKAFSNWGHEHLVVFAIAQIILWVILLIALSPQQQSLQDWARYRHRLPVRSFNPKASPTQDKAQGSSQSTFRPPSLWSDFVWGEKSPVLVAIALNLLMSLGFTLVWLLHHTLALGGPKIWAWLISTLVVFTAASMVMLIGTTLVQFVFLYRQQYAIVISLALLAVLFVGPLIGFGLAAAQPADYPDVWLSFFPWGTIHSLIPNFFPSIQTMIGGFMGLAAQMTCLGVLNWFLARQFKSIGESDVKALLRDT